MFQRDMFSFSWLWILFEIVDGSVLGVEQVALNQHFHTGEFCTLSLCHWHFKGLQVLSMFPNYPHPRPQNHSSVFSEPEIWLSAQDGTFKLESADSEKHRGSMWPGTCYTPQLGALGGKILASAERSAKPKGSRTSQKSSLALLDFLKFTYY